MQEDFPIPRPFRDPEPIDRTFHPSKSQYGRAPRGGQDRNSRKRVQIKRDLYNWCARGQVSR